MHHKAAITVGFFGLFGSTLSLAQTPLWSIVPLTSTILSVPLNVTATVQYTITNNASIVHTLMMKPIAGLTQVMTSGAGACAANAFTLLPGASCVLSLQTPASGLTTTVYGGPVICQQDVNGQPSPWQCYQPLSQLETLALTPASNAAIGNPLGGGVVACLNGSPYMNLVAATTDNASSSPGVIWGSLGLSVGASSTDDGASNTATIVANVSETTPNASTLCDNYQVDIAGNSPCQAGNTCYTDWFLPAVNQLNCLYGNRGSISGFTTNSYWSSTEVDANNAQSILFLTGVIGSVLKNNQYPVRCVRFLSL